MRDSGFYVVVVGGGGGGGEKEVYKGSHTSWGRGLVGGGGEKSVEFSLCPPPC